jgi:hypothetical protein
MDLISNSIRAVPFKYTWEGGTPLISDPPPPPIEKNISTHHHQNLLQ